MPQKKLRGNKEDRLHPSVREILAAVVEEKYFIDTRPTAKSVHERLVDTIANHNSALPQGDWLAVPSVDAVHTEIRKTDGYTSDFCRFGKRVADENWRPTGSSPATTRHNEVWEIDHTTVDCIVMDDDTNFPIGRPTVTSAIDRHTRVSPGLAYIGFDPPGVYPTMQFMRPAILPKGDALAELGLPPGAMPFFGKPDTLIPDQAKEFKARALMMGIYDLGIDIQYTPVLKPWYKGRIERFFRTLTRDVFQQLPGTTFSNIFERNGQNIPEKVAVVTLGELRRLTNLFLVQTYNRRRHRSLRGMSPLEAWQKSVAQHGMDPLPNFDRVMAALSPTVQFRKIHHYGIEFEGLIYNSTKLAVIAVRAGFEGYVRIVVDSLDLTGIRVVDPTTGNFVWIPIKASMLAVVTGVTLQKHKLAQALRRANPQKFGGELGMTHAYTLIDAAVRGRGGEGGMVNRRKAVAYWDKLTKAKPPEQAPMFDVAASAGAITDGLFNDMLAEPFTDDFDPNGNGMAGLGREDFPHETVAIPVDATPLEAAPRGRGRPKRQPPADEAPERIADGAADDLDALARSLGMNATKLEGDL